MQSIELAGAILASNQKPNIVHDPYKFKGFGIHNSECRVEIWADEEKALVLFTDTNKGTSVTNAAEQLVEEIYNKHLSAYPKEKCIFLETYDRYKLESVDLIVPFWVGNSNCVSSVEWKHLGDKLNPNPKVKY